MDNSVQKSRAIKLRKEGNSYRNIARKLKVSASSINNWCKNIKLTLEEKNLLNKKTRDPYYEGRGIYLTKLKRQTEQKIKKLNNQGIKEIGKLNNREMFIAGAALYWAEGFKKDSQVGLASLDPAMIKFFIKWLKTCFGYANKDLSLRVTVNISHKNRINEIQDFWSNELSIPSNQFQKPYFQDVKWKKIYDNPNEYFGVLRVKVRKSKDFLRKNYGFIEGLRLQAQ